MSLTFKKKKNYEACWPQESGALGRKTTTLTTSVFYLYIFNMDEKWEELNLRASSTICMSLAKNILTNVLGTSLDKELWKKLEGYITQRIRQIGLC
ncbi:hypothetical protein MTR_7g090360 [Medicago truncatula]|uniref:Uncharacterized protein n=1 Tax=Medicago truncatula TaxID=3880 RepID=G7KRP5_MEDTR|nr:hypothetical protein MTR_7g090360 [Medicago truncatula]